MGSGGVVSIRVEALGVSITIADGSIAIEQTKAEIPAAAVSKAEGSRHGLTGLRGDSGKSQEAPAATKRQSLPEPLPEDANNSTVRDSSARNSASVIDEFPRLSSPGSNGPTALPGDSGEDQEARSIQTKPLWSDKEVEKLRELYPTHSASAIGKQLGRARNAVRSKSQNLGLRKDGPPTVASKPAKPASKPRSLSAAVTVDSTPVPDGFGAVPLLDHHAGQCRWLITAVWPVMYSGAPVVGCSSWCEQHSKRVFNLQPRGLGASPHRISKKFR